MADSDFVLPDTTTADTSTELNTLFGVSQAVGTTPVVTRPGVSDNGNLTSSMVAGVATGALPLQSTSSVMDLLQGFYGMDPSIRANLQQQLWAGGFYSSAFYGKTPKMPQFGAHDDDSFAAFRKAVVQAARSGTTVDQVVKEAVDASNANGGPGGSSASTRAPLVTQLTNPDDIRSAVVQQAKAELGHKVDEATINEIITRYQQADAAAQAGVYGAQPGGGTVTAAPSLSAFAQQQVAASNPTDAAAHRGLGVGNLILNAFMSSAGNAPLGGTGG